MRNDWLVIVGEGVGWIRVIVRGRVVNYRLGTIYCRVMVDRM